MLKNKCVFDSILEADLAKEKGSERVLDNCNYETMEINLKDKKYKNTFTSDSA